MKTISALLASVAFLAGCASTESGRVYHLSDGTRVYGLNDQPQASIAGEGTLMPGAYETHTLPTGQFTGKERTQDLIGHTPVPPREADPRGYRRDSIPNAGAGSLGQTGIRPDAPTVSTSTIMTGPTNPSLAPSANPPTQPTAPALSEPLTRSANEQDNSSALGAPPANETFSASTRLKPAPQPASSNLSSDLTERIRIALSTGRPGSITHLSPERLHDFDIEAVDGNITLRGIAQSETEKLMIGNKVSLIQGVRSVNNQLRVPAPDRNDLEDNQSATESPATQLQPK